MMTKNNRLLDTVFGEKSYGDTPEERANSSDSMFVRSLDQIAFYNPLAMGRKLTAKEALDSYGWDVLAKVGEDGAALLCSGPKAAGNVLRVRREDLNLDVRHVASRLKVNVKIVEKAEATDQDLSIKMYEKIGRILGLDERYISVHEIPKGNEELAVRLRTATESDSARLTPTVVTGLAEAAWVASVQNNLELKLNIKRCFDSFKPSYNYGSLNYPAYAHGYYLARETRKKLELGDGPLPKSLREICEDVLAIPLIQTELGDRIAGATVQVSSYSIDDASPRLPVRAIVINLSGKNRNVFVRRSTLAHELGHVLYDPPGKLDQLRVDDYEDLEKEPSQIVDYVEQRANAFGVEFIAPQVAVAKLFKSNIDAGVNGIMQLFGISFTAARYHIWNAIERKQPFENLKANDIRPSSEWDGKEAYTTDYHPIATLPPSRAGRFSAIVVQAAIKEIISWDTAAEYLLTTQEEVRDLAEIILSLFPEVKVNTVERKTPGHYISAEAARKLAKEIEEDSPSTEEDSPQKTPTRKRGESKG